MKRLYIVRHGAAQSSFEAGSDFARRLVPAGEERVRAVAEHFAALPEVVFPQRIVSSAAPRAAQTARIWADVLGVGADRYAETAELYRGGPAVYLDTIVRSLPDEVSCAMAVGHNPAVSELLASLTGVPAGEYLMRKGDAACVAFDLPDDARWEELYAAEGEMERYLIAASV